MSRKVITKAMNGFRLVVNPGAPTGCTDNTLGGSDVVYQQSGKEVPCSVLLMKLADNSQ